jgi:lactate permease
MVGRQLPLFSLIIPFWLIAAQAGWRGMLQIWPACLACGASFAVVQFAVSNLHGPWLVDIAAGLASMFALVLVVRKRGIAVEKGALHMTARAWLPWLMLAGLVALWKVKPVDALLKSLADWKCKVPLIFEGIQRMPPVVRQPEFEKGVFDFPVFATTGTALLCAGLLAGLLLGVRPAALAKLYWQTMLRVRLSMLTIALMLSLGYVTRLSGTDTTLGLAFVATGSWFPFFSPLLGWLGVALTGSDTSSNVLFGNLQRVTAEQLGISPILTCGANSAGGVMGKMIDAQSIVVAQTASVGVPDAPDAGTILRAVFWHSLALAFLVGLLIWLQARVMPWMIPLP